MEGKALATSHVSPNSPSLLPPLPLLSFPLSFNTSFGDGVQWAACGGRFADLLPRRHLVRGTAGLSGKGNCQAFDFCFYTHFFPRRLLPLSLFLNRLPPSSTKILRMRAESIFLSKCNVGLKAPTGFVSIRHAHSLPADRIGQEAGSRRGWACSASGVPAPAVE